MNVPFVDLSRTHLQLKQEIDGAMQNVIARGAFIDGQEVAAFENAFAAYCGKKYAVAVASGTDALTLAIQAYNIREKEIITTANTFVATILAITHSGNIPILVDADETGNIDVRKIEEKITPKTKAILPVHLYGEPAKMAEIQALAKKYNLIIIEDACQAHGAWYQGKKIPVSETGCFSFYPAKNLGCFGDGGIVVTDVEEVATALKYLREYGSKIKYYHDYHDGFNSRLDTIQAAVLSVKLKKLDEGNMLRRQAAALYKKELADVQEITFPKEIEQAEHIYHLFTIHTEKRDALQQFLKEQGISTGIHYPVPLHEQKMFAALGYKKGDFPISERIACQTLSLPMFPLIKEEEILYVCKKIKDFFAKSRE